MTKQLITDDAGQLLVKGFIIYFIYIIINIVIKLP